MTRPHVLYVAGTGRSGSTIVAQYLEAHLDAVHVGEARYLWERGVDLDHLCECERPFSECPFWTKTMAGAFPEGVALARARMADLSARVDRLRHIPADIAVARGWRSSVDVEAYADLIGAVYEQVVEVSGSSLVIDSSKDPSYLFALRATGRLDLTMLHLVRDSRAVAYSWTREKVRPEVHGWEDQLMNQLPPALSARRWMQIHGALEVYGRLWGGPRERYEDFAADPDRCVDTVADVLGAARRTPPGQPSDRHSFSGNPIRFDHGPLRVRADRSWATELSRRDRRTVTLVTAPLLKKYGYPLW